jgi:hypothetical protein
MVVKADRHSMAIADMSELRVHCKGCGETCVWIPFLIS